MKKEIAPPFKPKVAEDSWIDNFDKDFTSMKPQIDDQDAKKFEPDKDLFKDWGWENNN